MPSVAYQKRPTKYHPSPTQILNKQQEHFWDLSICQSPCCTNLAAFPSPLAPHPPSPHVIVNERCPFELEGESKLEKFLSPALAPPPRPLPVSQNCPLPNPPCPPPWPWMKPAKNLLFSRVKSPIKISFWEAVSLSLKRERFHPSHHKVRIHFSTSKRGNSSYLKVLAWP